MEERILNILKSARTIEPTVDFRGRSSRALKGMPQLAPKSTWMVIRATLLENARFAVALSFVALFLVVFFGGFSQLASHEDPNKELVAEAKNIQFKIEIESAKYFNDSANEMTAMLSEIKTPPQGQSTDDLLNKVMF